MTTPAADPIVNALTVDVEDYFQVSAFERIVSPGEWDRFERRVVGNTRRLLEIFDRRSVHATFFVLGWVAEREPGLVREIAAAGHEIASHGYGHQLVYHQSREQFREDVRRARALLQAASGQAVMGYRAPSFSVTARSLWALDILLEEGYVYDASIFPIHHDRYGIPGAPRHAHIKALSGGQLVEIPASTVRFGGANLPVAGGGYFRLLPYWWTRLGLRRLNEAEGMPAVFYLHPWEIDPEQPRLSASLLSRFRHYRNLDRTELRLSRLLEEFAFAPVAQAILASTVTAA